MDKFRASKLHSRMAELCKSLEKEFGVKIFTHGGRLEETGATLKFRIMEVKNEFTAPTAANPTPTAPQLPHEIEGLRLYPNMIGLEVFFSRFGKVKFAGYNHKKRKYPFIFNICNKPSHRMKCSFDGFVTAVSAVSVPVGEGKKLTSNEQEILDAVADRKLSNV